MTVGTGVAIEADYLIMGAGAVGMAFADSLLTHSDATIVLVDRHDRPGGHWNVAYPFVRLHQPSSSYGVGSEALGTGRIDQVGHNAGFHELASGHEVVSHFDQVMRHRFLPSGRVRFLPMSEVGEDRTVTSLLSGRHQRVEARRFVDATHSRMQVPSTTTPSFRVSDDVAVVPPNDLPRVASDHDRFVVVGAGKTGMDACIWLLESGVEPDAITWIVSRDSWVLRRCNVQPGPEHFATFCKSIADQTEAVASAVSVNRVFSGLEERGELARIDPGVEPGAYHCAILSDAEIDELRRITNVVRLGRVTAIDEAIHLDHGTLPTGPEVLHVDCSAAGIPTLPSTPIFERDCITPQWVRTCQPTFSAALVGFVEATVDDEELKNHLCQPIVPPTVPLDWLRVLLVELDNRQRWIEHPALGDWMATTRLDPFTGPSRELLTSDSEAAGHIGRYLTTVGPARERLEELLATAGRS